MVAKILTIEKIQTLLPKRLPNSYKNQFGRLLIIAGNNEMGGAGIMASQAAVHVGSGLTTLASAHTNRSALHANLPEAMFIEWEDLPTLLEEFTKSSTILIGPGMGRGSKEKELLIHILRTAKKEQTVVLDGDALTIFAEELGENQKALLTQAQLILTPHPGEWQRISQASGALDAKSLAQKNGYIIVEKSRQTKIHTPDKNCYFNIQGTPGMSIGGMGDVLAGMISGLIGQVEKPLDAVLIGSFLHTYTANEIAQTDYIVVPSRLVAAIPKVMYQVFMKDKNKNPLI